MPQVGRGELAWIGLWAAGVVAFSTLPYALTWWLTPSGYVFTGILANPLDGFSYLAKMRQATEGAWLLHLPYTSVPHQAALLFPQYVLLGKVVALTGIAPILVYHAARIVSGLLMLGVSYGFIATIVTSVAVRKTAFLLLSTSSGLTWFTGFFGFLASDVTVPESNTFYSLFTNVHFPLASGLLTAAFLLVLKGLSRFPWTLMALGGMSNALMVLLQPFLLFSETVIAAIWALLLLGRGKMTLSLLRPSVLLLWVIPMLPLLLLARQLYADPVLAEWTAQNVTPSPPPWSYLAGYGLLVPLALLGLIGAWRRPRECALSEWGAVLLLAWAIAGVMLLYAPIPWQRRLSEGYHIPVSILAAVGLHTFILARMGEHVRQLVRPAVVGFCMMGSLTVAGASVLGARALGEPYYLSLNDYEALTWLAENVTVNDLALASPTMGNIAPAWSSAKVYWGHPYETVNAPVRYQHVLDFYSSSAATTARCDFLREAGVTLVYAGPLELRLGDADLAAQPGLVPAYRSGPVVVYRVTPCAAVALMDKPV